MAGMKAVLAFALLSSTAALELAHVAGKANGTANATLPMTFKVYVEGQPVLGDGAGTGALKVCSNFPDFMVSHPMKPEIKVCGTGIKMTVFLLGRCGVMSSGRALASSGMAKQWVVGACDKGLPGDTCKSFSPSTDKRFGAAQSYKIEQC